MTSQDWDSDLCSVNYAHVMGLAKDTNTNASQFSYLATAFYVGYLVCEIPQGNLLQRLPIGKYLGTCGMSILVSTSSLPFLRGIA